MRFHSYFFFFFFNDTATTEIYTLSLHDALPISRADKDRPLRGCVAVCGEVFRIARRVLDADDVGVRRQLPQQAGRDWEVCVLGDVVDEHRHRARSEEHTSELQSPCNLVCRLLLEKKKERLRL